MTALPGVEPVRGPGYLCVVRVGPERRQVTHTAPSLREARAWVAATKAADDADRFVAKSKTTLRELADLWLSARATEVGQEDGIREVTLNGYRSALSAPLIYLGDEAVQKITVARVRGMVSSMATTGGAWGRPLSHRSITLSLVTLRQVLRHGAELGLLTDNPATGVKPPRRRSADRRRAPVWSPAELVRFRNHVDEVCRGTRFEAEPWLRAGMRLTLCGLRRSEVLGLDWENVDLKTGEIVVAQGRVKTGRGSQTVTGAAKSDESYRRVPAEDVHPGTTAILRELWLAQGRPDRGYLITDLQGRPVPPDAYSRRFRGLVAEADLPDLGSIHRIRHSIATALHDAGVEPRKAASLLGHSVHVHITSYIPLSDSGAAEAALAAGDAFRSRQIG